MKLLDARHGLLDELKNLKKCSDEEKIILKDLKRELVILMRDLQERDKHILDQNDLITILVKKLYEVNNCLKEMDTYAKQSIVEIENATDDKRSEKISMLRSVLCKVQQDINKSIMSISGERNVLRKKSEEKQSDGSVTELQDKVDKINEENKRLREAIKHAKDQLNELEEQATRFLKEKEDIERKHIESVQKLDELFHQNNRSQEEFQKEIKQNLNIIDSLKRENNTCQNELCSLRQIENKLKDELHGARTEHRNSLDEVNQEKLKQAALVNSLKVQVEDLENKLKEKELQITEIEDQLKQKNMQIEKQKSIGQSKKKLKTKTHPLAESSDIFNEKIKASDFFDFASLESDIVDDDLHKSKVAARKLPSKQAAKKAEPVEPVAKKAYKSNLHWTEKTSKRAVDSNSSSDENEESSEAGELEIVIEQLSDSVHKMMSDSSKTSSSGTAKNKKGRKLTNKEDIMKSLKEKDAEIERERNSRSREIQNLKSTISEMEKALKDAQLQGSNLQKAVDLYLESITILEKSEEHSKLEISQQKVTISNLQKALVETKQHLQEYQQSGQQEILKNWEIINILRYNLVEMEDIYTKCINECDDLAQTVKYLENANLDLEVENFGHLQDITMLETRLQKYQQSSKTDQQCVCFLKEEIKHLKKERDKCLYTISLLQSELQQCGDDLLQLQQILQSSVQVEDYNRELLLQLEELKNNSTMFQEQCQEVQRELSKEQRINQVKNSRIRELEEALEKKVADINRLSIAFSECKKRLSRCLCENKQLQKQIETCEIASTLNDEQANFCHAEITSCLCNLQELKEKMKYETDLVNQKVLEYTQLQAVYNNQCSDMEILKREIDMTSVYYKDEIITLKHQIRELTDRTTTSECRCKQLQEELKDAQLRLVDTTQREALLQQSYREQEGMLVEKLHASQNEEIRLVEYTTALESDLAMLKDSMSHKDKQLESFKNTLSKMRSENGQKQVRSQEEINSLKNELNVLIQKHNSLMEENELLQSEVSKIAALKCQCQSLSEQLDQAYIQMQRISSEKDALARKNDDLSAEIQSLYSALNEMNNEYHYKTESVMMELVDTKQSRDALCHEGRNVIRNVRSWIMEQQTINNRLKSELRDKRVTIAKLKKENEFLLSSRNNSNYPVVPYRKMKKYKRMASPPPPAFNWDLGSRGSSSERDTPCSSISTNVQLEWYGPLAQEIACEKPTTWVHRVESMTQDLQRSNQYWQSKLSDHDSMVSRDN